MSLHFQSQVTIILTGCKVNSTNEESVIWGIKGLGERRENYKKRGIYQLYTSQTTHRREHGTPFFHKT